MYLDCQAIEGSDSDSGAEHSGSRYSGVKRANRGCKSAPEGVLAVLSGFEEQDNTDESPRDGTCVSMNKEGECLVKRMAAARRVHTFACARIPFLASGGPM